VHCVLPEVRHVPFIQSSLMSQQSVSEHMQRTIFLHTAPLETDEAMSDRHRQLSFTEWLEVGLSACCSDFCGLSHAHNVVVAMLLLFVVD